MIYSGGRMRPSNRCDERPIRVASMRHARREPPVGETDQRPAADQQVRPHVRLDAEQADDQRQHHARPADHPHPRRRPGERRAGGQRRMPVHDPHRAVGTGHVLDHGRHVHREQQEHQARRQHHARHAAGPGEQHRDVRRAEARMDATDRRRQRAVAAHREQRAREAQRDRVDRLQDRHRRRADDQRQRPVAQRHARRIQQRRLAGGELRRAEQADRRVRDGEVDHRGQRDRECDAARHRTPRLAHLLADLDRRLDAEEQRDHQRDAGEHRAPAGREQRPDGGRAGRRQARADEHGQHREQHQHQQRLGARRHADADVVQREHAGEDHGDRRLLRQGHHHAEVVDQHHGEHRHRTDVADDAQPGDQEAGQRVDELARPFVRRAGLRQRRGEPGVGEREHHHRQRGEQHRDQQAGTRDLRGRREHREDRDADRGACAQHHHAEQPDVAAQLRCSRRRGAGVVHRARPVAGASARHSTSTVAPSASPSTPKALRAGSRSGLK